MNGVTDLNLAWLAGIADGEGHLSLKSYRGRQGQPCVQGVFTVGNTNLDLMIEVRRIVAGLTGEKRTLYLQKRHDQAKDLWSIQVLSMRGLKLCCEAMLPYLVAKKRQAEIILEFVQIGRSYGNIRTGRNVNISQRRHPLLLEIRALNRRGKPQDSQRETERRAPGRDEETVRPTRRRVEAAETTARLLPFEKVAK
jgi:hypothetical protein